MSAPQVKTRRLGRTGLEISEVGFGTWGIGRKMWQGGSDGDSLAALARARQLGINFFDTALAYGDGHSERLLARAFGGGAELPVVATKIPPRNRLWPAQPGIPLREVFPLEHVKRCTEESLANLARETVDLQQFHVWNPEWLEDGAWREAVEWLKSTGKARFVGVSANDHQPASVIPALRTGLIDTVQVIYNIFDQSPADELFEVCRELDIGVIARVPLDEGGLTGSVTPATRFPRGDWRDLYFKGERKRQVWERVRRLQQDLGDSEPLARRALRFCLSHPAVSTVIPGMRTAGRVEQNAAASTAGPLPATTLELLRRHRWVRNYYPG